MKRSLLTGVLASIAPPVLATAQGADIGGYGVPPPLASVCFTYSSTYLETISPGPAVATVTQPGGAVTVTQPSSQASTTAPAFFDQVILEIIPLTAAGRKRQAAGSGVGGFVSTGSDPNPESCTDATTFNLGGGELTLDGDAIFVVLQDDVYIELRTAGTPPAGAITTTFASSNGFIAWENFDFLTGAATFCQVTTTGQVYAVFEDEYPEDCVTVALQVFNPADCQNGNITPVSSSVSTTTTSPESIPTAGPSTTSQFTFYPNSSITSAPSGLPSSTSSSTSSAGCSFATSGSVLSGGGFEDGETPFVVTQEGDGFTISILPSSDSPAPNSEICGYFLSLSFAGGNASTLVYTASVPTTAGDEYTITFQGLANAGSQLTKRRTLGARQDDTDTSGSTWTVSVDSTPIADGQPSDGTPTWQTYSGQFTATGDDNININITAQGGPSYYLFDNFVIVANSVQPSQSSEVPSSSTESPSTTEAPPLSSIASTTTASSTSSITLPPQPTITAGLPFFIDLSPYLNNLGDIITSVDFDPSTTWLEDSVDTDAQTLDGTAPSVITPGIVTVTIDADDGTTVQPYTVTFTIALVYGIISTTSGGSLTTNGVTSLPTLPIPTNPLTSAVTTPSASASASTSSSSTSSAFCPFSTSGSIFADGGFEAPSQVGPFTLGGQVSLSAWNQVIITSAASPTANQPSDLCSYVVEFQAPQLLQSGNSLYQYNLTTVASQAYSLSFEAAACGSITSQTFAVSVNSQVLVTVAVPVQCSWSTYHYTFTANTTTTTLGIDLVALLLTDASYYFDNFIIVPTSVSSSTTAATASATSTRR